MSLAPRLLLATEDVSLSRTLSWVLKENGYDVVTALGGPQLVERLEQEVFDLLVLDIGSGDAGRMDRLTTLREGRSHGDMPVLVLAERGFEVTRLLPLGLQAGDVVHRPYRVRDLLSRIKAHLRVGRELNRARAETRSRQELVEVLKEVSAAFDPDQIYQILVRRVAQGLRITRCSVVLAHAGDEEGIVVAAYENPTLRALPVRLEKYPEIVRALQGGETVLVDDVEQSPLYADVRATWAPEQGAMRTRSVIALPFALGGVTAGVFFLRTTADDPPLNPMDLHFAEQVIAAAVTALEKAHALQATEHPTVARFPGIDPVTDLPNNGGFLAQLDDELERARRYGQQVSIVVLEVTGIPDAVEVRHEILAQAAALFRRELRAMDSVARIGATSFAMILPTTHAGGARVFADRVQLHLVHHAFGSPDAPVVLGAAAGIATFPNDGAADGESLIARAIAMQSIGSVPAR
jgi:two-component system cell cycle response regulator